MATYEEATACPKCGISGNVRVDRKLNDGSRLLSVYCENTACKWYDTPWNVSVRADGSIPDPVMHKGPKTYMDITHDNEEAQRLINYLTMMDEESKQ